jgi:hypothetical protein
VVVETTRMDPTEVVLAQPAGEFAILGSVDGDEGLRRDGAAPSTSPKRSASTPTAGPDTPMRGHGLLALTAHGVAHGVPPGALRI